MGDGVLAAVNVTCGYEEREVLDDVGMELRRGEFLGLIGPNGSGKTTLLRALTGQLRPSAGEIMLDGVPMRQQARREVARRLAVVPQMSVPPFEFTVEEIVAMGRSPHLGRLQSEGADDRTAVDRALALTHTRRLAGRPVTELSGGEFQRTVIARALAQEARLMLLDEPVAHLDIGHQVEIFELLRRLNRDEGRSILCVSHDLNLASRYCDRLIAMEEGRVVAEGSPGEVLTAERMGALYRCTVQVDTGPGGRPRVTAVGSAAGEQGS